MVKTVSHEKLADAALNAALEVRRSKTQPSSDLVHLRELIQILRDPIGPQAHYKLLTDARNLGAYKEAWELTFGSRDRKLKTDVFMKRLSDFLERSVETVQRGEPKDVEAISGFCLALSRLFLEKSAGRLTTPRSLVVHELT